MHEVVRPWRVQMICSRSRRRTPPGPPGDRDRMDQSGHPHGRAIRAERRGGGPLARTGHAVHPLDGVVALVYPCRQENLWAPEPHGQRSREEPERVILPRLASDTSPGGRAATAGARPTEHRRASGRQFGVQARIVGERLVVRTEGSGVAVRLVWKPPSDWSISPVRISLPWCP
jgi:hypothetical protein